MKLVILMPNLVDPILHTGGAIVVSDGIFVRIDDHH